MGKNVRLKLVLSLPKWLPADLETGNEYWWTYFFLSKYVPGTCLHHESWTSPFRMSASLNPNQITSDLVKYVSWKWCHYKNVVSVKSLLQRAHSVFIWSFYQTSKTIRLYDFLNCFNTLPTFVFDLLINLLIYEAVLLRFLLFV